MVSWYKEVKFLYTIFINTVFFIFLNFIYSLNMPIKSIAYMYLVNLLIIMISKYIACNTFPKMDRYKKLLLSGFIVTIFLSPIIIYFIGIKFCVIDIIINVLSLSFMEGHEEVLFSHVQYKDKIKKGMILCLVVGIFMDIFRNNQFQNVLKFYFFSIIIGIILLRESRNYDFKIKNKYSKFFNIVISIVIMILSIEPVYKIFYSIINFFKKIMLKILNIVLTVLEKIVALICGEKIYNIQQKLSTMYTNRKKLSKSNLNNTVGEVVKSNRERDIFLKIVFYLLGWIAIIIIIVCIILILYKLYNYIVKKNCISILEDEEDEVIENTRHKSRENYFKLFKNLFRGERGIKESIIFIYTKFLGITYKKKLFKTYMTPTMLSNVLKIHIRKSEELDNISKIYNETKFSDHNIEKDKLEKIRKNYNKIKKELKKL